MFSLRYLALIFGLVLVAAHAAPSALVQRSARFSTIQLTLPVGAIGDNFVVSSTHTESGKTSSTTKDDIYHLKGEYKGHASGKLLVKVWTATTGTPPDAPLAAYDALKALNNDVVAYGMLSNPPMKIGSKQKSIPIIIYKYEASLLTSTGKESTSKTEAMAKVKAVVAGKQ